MNYLALLFIVFSALLLAIDASQVEVVEKFVDTLNKPHQKIFGRQNVLQPLIILLKGAQEKFTDGNVSSNVKIQLIYGNPDGVEVLITNGIANPSKVNPLRSFNEKTGVMSYTNGCKMLLSPPYAYFPVINRVTTAVDEWKTTIFSTKSKVLAPIESEDEELMDDLLNKEFIEMMEGHMGISRLESKAGIVEFALVLYENEDTYDFEMRIEDFSVQKETIGTITLTAILNE